MTLLSRTARAMLAANYRSTIADLYFDPIPVIRLFNPVGRAVWLATEIEPDDDTLFGLADMGFGCPELGSFSLAEIEAIRLPHGRRIEIDRRFSTRHALSIWAEAARLAHSIPNAAELLDRLMREDPQAIRLLPRDERGEG